MGVYYYAQKYNAELKTRSFWPLSGGQGGECHLCQLHGSQYDLKWKLEFLQNAHRAFDSGSEQKKQERERRLT